MRRILVVDDDLHVGQAIGVWLQHHGFRVSIAGGGSTGLAALDRCLTETEPHRRHLATLGAVVDALSEAQARQKPAEIMPETSFVEARRPRRVGGAS